MRGIWVMWLCFVAVRVGWSMLPQMGYIHPDEFFQTVEVVAGDALNISIERTWEFNSTFPLRSIVLPKVLFQPVFWILHYLSVQHGLFSLTGRLVLISTRLVMVILSLWIDYCVYKICKLIGVQCETAALLLASSYVTLTFQTHSFSNSIETVCLITEVLIFVLLVKSKVIDNFKSDQMSQGLEKIVKMLQQRSDQHEADQMSDKLPEQMVDQISELHKSAFSLRHRAKSNEKISDSSSGKGECTESLKESSDPLLLESAEMKKMNVKSKDFDNCYSLMICLALVNTIGVFNRPTFALFAMGPFVWWFDIHQFSKQFYKQLTSFIFASLLFFIVIVLIDSIYYSEDENPIYSLLYNFDPTSLGKLMRTYVITPLNFLLYNTAATNLAEHGLHAPYIHLLVNMPLLFGPLLIPFVYMAYKEGKQWYQNRTESEPDDDDEEEEDDSTVDETNSELDNPDENTNDSKVHKINAELENENIKDEILDKTSTELGNPDKHINDETLEENIINDDENVNDNVNDKMPATAEVCGEYKTLEKNADIKGNSKDIEHPEDDSNVKVYDDIEYEKEIVLPKRADTGLNSLAKKVESKLQSDLKGDLLLFILFPVLALSVFPHQEARFLIPLLPLMCLSVTLEGEYGFHKLFWVSLFIFNIVLSIVFGIFHQGGVVPCLLQLQKIANNHQNNNPESAMTIIFSHTYMPPKHLLLLNHNSNVFLEDLKGQDLKSVYKHLWDFHPSKGSNTLNGDYQNKTHVVYFAVSGSLVKHVDTKLLYRSCHCKLKTVETFFPHLSFEDLPNVRDIKDTTSLYDSLSLHLFQVKFMKK